MDLIAFAGPSLGREQFDAPGQIEFRPPARCGDITRAVHARPTAIGLIDGVFETAPSVWHKEIVHALSLGVTVFGAASIGALRAVELAPFGMIGIGEVYRAYSSGEIEDDDEVAVLHGPAELGFQLLSEAMVNVRATLDTAGRAGVLCANDRSILGRAAKSIFYKHRTWESIAKRAVSHGLSILTLERFEGWRTGHHIDVKKRDAQLLISAMLSRSSAACQTFMLPKLNRTTYWIAHEERCELLGTRDSKVTSRRRTP